MAERRMFAKTIIDSDAFLDMPQSTQLLYFHLSMRADDDGFINKPKSIMRAVGCKDDDIKVLISKKFIIPFDSGVVVIKHWKIHNYIRKDMYQETKYKDEKALLMLDENSAYRLIGAAPLQDRDVPVTNPLQERNEPVTNPSTQVSIGKDRLGKVRLGKSEDSIETEFSTGADELADTDEGDKLQLMGGTVGQGVLLISDNQIADLINQMGLDGFQEYGRRVSDYIINKKAKITSAAATILKWWQEDLEKRGKG